VSGSSSSSSCGSSTGSSKTMPNMTADCHASRSNIYLLVKP
jgi:hypothetical protein